MDTLLAPPTVPKRDWIGYYVYTAITEGNAPSSLMQSALAECESRDHALDLGSGTLNATLLMVQSGFKKVLGVDSSPEAALIARVMQHALPNTFTFERKYFHEFEFGHSRFDVVHSSLSLPYAGTSHFKDVLQRAIGSLRPNGLFAVSLFGNEHHASRNTPDLVFVRRDDMPPLLSGLDYRIVETMAGSANHKVHHLTILGKKTS